MLLGMSLATFTMVHVIISLVAIGAGLVEMFGMLGSKRMPNLTAVFLASTILTSASGLLIPPLLFDKPLPSHMISILSLVLLGIACLGFTAGGSPDLGAGSTCSLRSSRCISTSSCW